MKKRRTKRKTSEILWKHAKRRAWQRFGLLLNRSDRKDIVLSSQKGEAELLGRQSIAKSIWVVKCQGRDMVAVYDKNRHAIVTFLTEEMVSSNVDQSLGHTWAIENRGPSESQGEETSPL